MGTEPGRAVLGSETEHEAQLSGGRDELGAAALPLARGGDELPPDIRTLSSMPQRPYRASYLHKLTVTIQEDKERSM